jgi:predicted TIM-barrel fold metal-dependent hydrolase
MIIVDSHAHFWKEPPDRSLVFRDHQEPIGYEQLIKDMDEAGVDKLIQLTRGLMGFDNSYSIEGATRFPDRFRVMGRFDAAASDAVAQLRGWLKQPYVVGIRMMTIAKDEGPLFENGAVSKVWPEAENAGIPIAIYAPDRSKMLGDIAARHPGLTLIVDHIGMRVFDIFKTPPSENDQPNLMALKRYPNVVIKVSGIPEALVERYPFPRSQLRLQKIYDNFGPDRMMWGSNYPPITQICTYKQSLDFIREDCRFLSDDDKARILGRTASSILKVPWA